jgi:hypothetical protein
MTETITIQKKEYEYLKRKAELAEELIKKDKNIEVTVGVLKGFEDIKNGRIREID